LALAGQAEKFSIRNLERKAGRIEKKTPHACRAYPAKANFLFYFLVFILNQTS